MVGQFEAVRRCRSELETITVADYPQGGPRFIRLIKSISFAAALALVKHPALAASSPRATTSLTACDGGPYCTPSLSLPVSLKMEIPVGAPRTNPSAGLDAQPDAC